MEKTRGNYFIIFDSDCIIPANYLIEVENALKRPMWIVLVVLIKLWIALGHSKGHQFCDDFFLTTGGIRGGSEKIGKFQPTA